MSNKAKKQLSTPVYISVKQVYYTSHEFDVRLRKCAEMKGIKITDVSRIAAEKFLTDNGC